MAGRVLGIDIGSRSVDAIWLLDGEIVDSAVADSGFDPASVAAAFVDRGAHDMLVATGYGRHAARETLGAAIITEIKAFAVGASALFPEARAVLDIGGQDTKVISLAPGGRVADFEMNDKCAAGTGKFLEVMARALGFTLGELGVASIAADAGVQISSMCTVFAESEVTGLVHRGEDRGRIARGLHESIARRTLGSLKRIGAFGPLVFAGGVARNPAMVELIAQGYESAVLVPHEAQLVGAYGAALSASAGSSGAGVS
jgi:predicted CoA-substrate-specific enzyme activase